MQKEELKRIKKSIKNFLRSNQKVLKLKYKDTYLNPTKYYHRALLGNPLWFIYKWTIITTCTILPASGIKNMFYRLLGMKIGKDVAISWGAIFDMGYPQLITIGDGAIIGTGVKILTHETTVKRIRVGRINIGKKALVGVRSIIRSGTSIGKGAVVGMGAVVVNDVKPHEFVGGVPAKRIKKLKKLI